MGNFYDVKVNTSKVNWCNEENVGYVENTVRLIAERNNLEVGEDINAEIEYQAKNKINQTMVTIVYRKNEIELKEGLRINNFDNELDLQY